MLWVPPTGPPRLVLPEGLWDRLDEVQRDAVLVHELAHLKRRDHWVRRLEAAVLGLYWWDPVAWWARREVERSEEECCDAWVIWALPAAAGAYAEALLSTAAYVSGHWRVRPLGASGVGRLVSLKRRLNMIVCDSVTGSVVRTTPRALLVLGVLSLPLLPGMRQAERPGNSAQAAAPQDTVPDEVDMPRSVPVRNQEPSTPAALAEARQGATKRELKVRVFQPISREVGEFLDIPEPQFLTARHVDLRSRIGGQIVQVHCRPGQAVKKDQVLFEIDPASHKVKLDRAEAEVRRTQAHQKRWDAEWKSAKAMKRNVTISDSEFQRIESEHEEARALLQVAQADRDLARLDLEATRVKSPIDGVVKKTVVELGETVPAAGNGLATIISLDPLHADFYMDEASARVLDRSMGGGKIKTGVKLDLPVLIGVGDEIGYTHRGRLDFVGPEIQPVAENAILCRATIPNGDRSLMPGKRARFRFAVNARHKALLVPNQSFRFEPYAERGFVSVVNSQNLVEIRPVRFGPVHDGLREVEDGLKPDDWVTVEFMMWANKGQKVIPEKVTSLAGP